MKMSNFVRVRIIAFSHFTSSATSVKIIFMKINYTLKAVETDKELIHLSKLAYEIWHEYFPALLSEAQINYMVEKFQSYDALKTAIENGCEYFLLKKGEMPVGYVGIREEERFLFLSKLYLRKDYRGKGLGYDMLETVLETAERRKKEGVYLTVNRFNDQAIRLYAKIGFQTTREQLTDIGNGFVMDDFIMEYRFPK